MVINNLERFLSSSYLKIAHDKVTIRFLHQRRNLFKESSKAEILNVLLIYSLMSKFA